MILPSQYGTNIEQTLSFSQEPQKNGGYIHPILHPVGAKNDSPIRMSLSALHAKEQLDYTLVTILKILKCN